MCYLRRFYRLPELYDTDLHKPGSMEAREYGLTRRTRFIAYRVKLDAVAGLLWISWCVFGGVFFFFFFPFLFCFNEHGLLQV